MFPDLPPAWHPQSVLAAIGRQGGPMDAAKTRTQTVPVGQVFFGQFIDHDITLDVTSGFSSVNDPESTPNARTPTLDLDCVYGAGPDAHPYIYAQTTPFAAAKLLTGADMPGATALQKDDLLRAPNHRAIIGDPRNDENRIISQLQLAMIRFHNNTCDALQAAPGSTLADAALFAAARREVTWHYQWSIVNDFLVTMCGKAVVDDILGCGRRFYCPDIPYIPIEFAVAAYRFGHSMVPMAIQVRKNRPAHPLFGNILGKGFVPLDHADGVVDWNEVLFTPANRAVQRAEMLDTSMAHDLLKLPFITSGEASLATRNLMRGNSFLLPGGEKVAAAIGRTAAEIASVLARIGTLSAGAITEGVPLWLYLLAEAETVGRETSPGHFDPGEGLGPVGARIVAEVLIGLMELDPQSWLGADRNWTPRAGFDSIGKILASTL